MIRDITLSKSAAQHLHGYKQSIGNNGIEELKIDPRSDSQRKVLTINDSLTHDERIERLIALIKASANIRNE